MFFGLTCLVEWTFESLFGRTIRNACPVAISSIVEVNLSQEKEGSGYSLEPKANMASITPDVSKRFDVHARRVFYSVQNTEWLTITCSGQAGIFIDAMASHVSRGLSVPYITWCLIT